MKIVFSEEEIKEIILSHVRRTAGYTMHKVDFHSYNYDFCVVTQDEKKADDISAPGSDPFKDL